MLIRPPNVAGEDVTGAVCGLSVVDAILRGESTLGEQQVLQQGLVNSFAVASSLEMLFGWAAVGEPDVELLAQRLPREVMNVWKGYSTSPGTPRQSKPKLRLVQKFWVTLGGVRAGTASAPVATEGFGFGTSYERLVETLDADSPQWRRCVFNDDLSGVSGRHVGRRLFEITGDDPGLWMVACDLLENWDRPLQEWLDTVHALT